MRVKQYFGFSTKICCDRCKNDVTKDFYTLCDNCFQVDSTKLRLHTIKISYRDKIEGKTCALCMDEILRKNEHHVCKICLSKHPDNTHMGWYINADYSNKELLYRHCYCGDIAKIQTGQEENFEYYKLGSKVPTTEPYSCTKRVQVGSEICRHDWIIIGSNIKSIEDGKQEFLRMKKNSGLMMLGLGEIGLENMAFGSTRYWCYKCGCHYDLSPLKDHLLPNEGYIK